jgi:glutathione peroxidase-family protein
MACVEKQNVPRRTAPAPLDLRNDSRDGKLPISGAETMKKWLQIGMLAGWIGMCGGVRGEGNMKTIYDFTLPDIDGRNVSLSNFKGKVLLVVNVASKCGFTGQYAGLEKLYKTYAEKGLVVLGFPANNFMGQEPGTEADIKSFCTLNYGVTFPMFAKISVKGKEIHPLYAFLTSEEHHGENGGAVSWNFNKFLIGRDGTVRAHFGSRTEPDDPTLAAAIEKVLAEE